MLEWNRKDPESWAEVLGLVSVPLFGAARSNNLGGTHAMMLDGEAGSFSLSISDGSPIPASTANRWSWSSNVLHSVVLNRTGKTATVRRWDTHSEDQWPIANEGDVRSLFRSFEDTPETEEQTVIDRGLQTFLAVRTAVEQRGANQLDVVLAFNTLVAYAARIYGHTVAPLPGTIDFAGATDLLHRAGALNFEAKDISRGLRSYPLGDLARLLVEGDNGAGYLLEADLLVRHASGTLYEEAHKQLLSPTAPDRQSAFGFYLTSGRPRPHGPGPSYVHYTPPSLARSLVEVALKFADLDCQTIRVLDPACGSGVFLIEALRELGKHETGKAVHLEGIDESDVAVAMADFCVGNAINGIDNIEAGYSIINRNSLELPSWGSPNLILMNPPFLSWRDQPPETREIVARTLGPAHSGRPDIASAFIFRAAESLAPGGGMAAVVPSSFLESESASLLREYLSKLGEFRVHLVGQFGYGFFNATVQPAFIAISRSRNASPVRIVWADAQRTNVDAAIRSLRQLPWKEPRAEPGFELRSIEQHLLPPYRWTPQRQATADFAAEVTHNTLTTVSDFFVPRLGVRVGDKKVFMLTQEELDYFCTTQRARSYFRPIADEVVDCVIRPSGFIFYPYATNGRLRLETEEVVRDALPRFYEERLRPKKIALLKRKSRYREWWEVSRPVATWLAPHVPRIVVKEFGRRGNFGIDRTGEYAVVQGFGWCWKAGEPHERQLLAYLALLNSDFFDSVLAAYCPRVQGGQYVLRRHIVDHVPLPPIEERSQRDALATIGDRMSRGKTHNADAREALVKEAYGITATGKARETPELDSSRLQRRFADMADEWEEATAISSRVEQMIEHPLYKEIISLGRSVVPLILRRMRDDPGYWSSALEELTGENPVPSGAHSLKAAAKAWIEWGRQKGYDV
jgi:hypothetical protein